MYIIDDTYFNAPKRSIPNLDEADSKAFVELELLIDEKCRLLLQGFLTPTQFQEFNGYLVEGMFPTDAEPTPEDPDEELPDVVYIPQKWIDLVNGVTYSKNDIDLVWRGLIYSLGTSKQSLLADYVYSFFLESQASYMTGVGDAKGNPKGANSVNPTQRYVSVWNDFVKAYQGESVRCSDWTYGIVEWRLINGSYPSNRNANEVSLIQFLSDKNEDYPNNNRKFFEVKNQLGL